MKDKEDRNGHQDDSQSQSKTGDAPDGAASKESGEDAPVKKKKVWPSKYNKGPFICSYCGKKFRGLLDLTRHERTHTNDKPLVCEECGKAFSCESSLRFHMDGHRNRRPFPCPKCDMRFRHKSTLNEHMVVHTDLRPFVCKVCGTALRQRTSLRKHMRIHTGERPYACEICGKTFRGSATCRLHQERHANPDSRVNRIPKEPRRIRKPRKYAFKTYRRSFFDELLRTRSQNLSQVTSNGMLTATAGSVPVHTQVNSTPSLNTLAAAHENLTNVLGASVSHSVRLLNSGQVTANNTSEVTSIVQEPSRDVHKTIGGMKVTPNFVPNSTLVPTNGSSVTAVTSSVTQSYPLVASGSMASPMPNGVQLPSNSGPLVTAYPTPGTSNGASHTSDGTSAAVNGTAIVPVNTLTSDSPIVVNANQMVTFNFTPMMVIKTPFGKNLCNSGVVKQ